MAKLVSIELTLQSCRVEDGKLALSHLRREGKPLFIADMPMLFWKNGDPWGEANDYLFHRAESVFSGELKMRTVQPEAVALHAYAKWLTAENVDWKFFPARRAERCLVQYRGYLINAIKRQALATSTASGRMRVALKFYQWAISQGVLEGEVDLELNEKIIQTYDQQGFPYMKRVLSSNLAIPNRKVASESLRLEDGVEPVSNELRLSILNLAKEHSPIELYLMLSVGFNTGMRLGTIADLKIETLEKALAIDGTDLALAISIGPEADPPVATKFGKSSRGIPISRELRSELLDYASSQRRVRREGLANEQDKNLLFLTDSGKSYVERGLNGSPAINSLMVALKKIAKAYGVDIKRFKFHCTRATFATGYAQIGVERGRIEEAIAFLRVVMLHKDESTTWRYIRYVKNEKERAELADKFTREMFGICSNEVSPTLPNEK